MDIDIDFFRKYLLILLQPISFILFILPSSTSLPSTLFPLIFIISEIFIFLPLILKMKKRYFYIGWETQIFFLILFNILFNYQDFFKEENISTTVMLFFSVMLFLIQIILVLYIFYREKIIQKVLFILASSTTLIVFLIVIFVFSEGAPAFQENEPIDLIFGSDWLPFYSTGVSHTETITTIIEPYNYSIQPEIDNLSMRPYDTEILPVYLINHGAKENTITLTINSSLNVNLEDNNITIPPNDTKKINLTINSAQRKHTTIDIIGKSKFNNQILTKKIHCHVDYIGFNIYPETQEILSKGDDIRPKAQIQINNIGNSTDEYLITIESNNKFRPSIEEVNWNYTTSSTIISLSANEKRNLTILPRIIDLTTGEYQLNITVQSKTNPQLQDTIKLEYTHIRLGLFNIEQTQKNSNYNQKTNYTISLHGNLDEDLVLTLDQKIGNQLIKILDQNTTIINKIGSVNYTLKKQGTTNLTLQITVIENTSQNIFLVNITVSEPITEPSLGFFAFIVGTLITTLLAILIAAPMGLAVAILLAEYTPTKIRTYLRPLYELLAGIPSVLYGLFGWYTFGPAMAQTLYPILTNTLGQIIPFFTTNRRLGEGILTASIVLSIMIIPIVITLSEDAIRSVRRELKEASLAMGATRWQTMRHIIIPKAKSGITSSIILGTGRAIGETMAVLMIMGATTRIPDSIFDRVTTMTGIIASDFGWAYNDPPIRHALFALGSILFIMVFCLNIVIVYVSRERKKQKNRLTLFKKPLLNITKSNFKKRTSNQNKKFSIIKELDSIKKFQIIQKINTIYDKETTTHNIKKLNIQNTINNSNKNPLFQQKIMISLLILCTAIISFFLFWILGDILFQGGLSIRLEYLLEVERMGGVEGGFLNAIIGSILLVLISLLFAGPLSIGAAIYVQEYSKTSNLLTKIILFTSDTLASTPSIVFGAFGFMFLVVYLDFGFSLIAGGLTLGFMIIPLMLRSSIEAIKSVPIGIREGSYALGVTKWQTIIGVVIPPALTGIVSGIILAIGRAIGETAAVLLTVGYALEIPDSILRSAASLPNMIFNYYDLQARHPELGLKVFAGAFLLIIIVMILNTIARLFSIRSGRMLKN